MCTIDRAKIDGCPKSKYWKVLNIENLTPNNAFSQKNELNFQLLSLERSHR